jgi:ABC-2 type transport system ATP-binding protein
MIEVRNLTKVYGETVAVDGVSFTVREGEILGFLGPNGAGKSTTMRVLTGYTPATSGAVRVGGFDVSRESQKVRRILGYLPENAPVYDEMTARGYVGFFAEVKGLRGAARNAAVDQALEECGLADVAGRLLMNLSKGYRQRAGLAQAVVGDPKVLILDEPTIGLDPKQIREVRALIRAMAGRRTVILSTHILPEVSLTCSRVVIINRGRVVASGTPENIHAGTSAPNILQVTVRGPRKEARALLEKVNGVRRVSEANLAPATNTMDGVDEVDDADGVDGAGQKAPASKLPIHESGLPIHEYEVHVEGNRDLRAELARAVVGSGFDLLEMRSTAMNLEDIFIQTIAGEGGSV